VSFTPTAAGTRPGSLSIADNAPGSPHTVTLTGQGVPTLSALSPAQVWVGLKNSDDVGIRFDLRAEAYEDGTLVASGQLNSVAGGGSGFNNAKLDAIPFGPFAPTGFPAGSTLSLKLYVRNACTGPTHNAGTARLWFNDGAANSHFGATIGASTSDYFLRDAFALATTAGPGPKMVDVAAGAPCSPFKPSAPGRPPPSGRPGLQTDRSGTQGGSGHSHPRRRPPPPRSDWPGTTSARPGWATSRPPVAPPPRCRPDASFDLLCNAYLLDLIPFAQVPSILGEFHRVLAPVSAGAAQHEQARAAATDRARAPVPPAPARPVPVGEWRLPAGPRPALRPAGRLPPRPAAPPRRQAAVRGGARHPLRTQGP
jgi:hypothetical protein